MTTAEQHPVKIERFSRNLRTPLSDREIVARARRAAHLAAEIEQLEEEAKASQKQAKARIEEIQAEQRRLNLEVADGAVHRETPCERRYIYRTGVVQEVRVDLTDPAAQLLHERPMTERERQPDLPGVDEASQAAGDDDNGIVDDDYVPDGSTEEPELETERPKKRGGRRKPAATEAE